MRAAGRSCRGWCAVRGGRPRRRGPPPARRVQGREAGDDLAGRQALVLVDRQVGRRRATGAPCRAGVDGTRRDGSSGAGASSGAITPRTGPRADEIEQRAGDADRLAEPAAQRQAAVARGAGTAVRPTSSARGGDGRADDGVQHALDLGPDRIVRRRGHGHVGPITRRSGRRRRRRGTPGRWIARAGSSSGTAARRPASAAGDRPARRARRAPPRPRPLPPRP